MQINVLPHLKSFPLQALSVRLQRSSLYETASFPVFGDEKYRELGTAIADTITSLRCLSIRLPSSRDSPCVLDPEQMWWMIERDECKTARLHPVLPGPKLGEKSLEGDFKSLKDLSEC